MHLKILRGNTYFLTGRCQADTVGRLKVAEMRKNDFTARSMLFPAATLITSGLARVVVVTAVVISMHT